MLEPNINCTYSNCGKHKETTKCSPYRFWIQVLSSKCRKGNLELCKPDYHFPTKLQQEFSTISEKLLPTIPHSILKWLKNDTKYTTTFTKSKILMFYFQLVRTQNLQQLTKSEDAALKLC